MLQFIVGYFPTPKKHKRSSLVLHADGDPDLGGVCVRHLGRGQLQRRRPRYVLRQYHRWRSRSRAHPAGSESAPFVSVVNNLSVNVHTLHWDGLRCVCRVVRAYYLHDHAKTKRKRPLICHYIIRHHPIAVPPLAYWVLSLFP